MSEKTAADLAAGVRMALTTKVSAPMVANAVAALDALVARVDTLTRERDEALDRESGTSDAFQDANASATGYRRDRDEWRRRAGSAEAALTSLVYVALCGCGDGIPVGQCARCRAVKLLGFDPALDEGGET